MVKYYRNIIFEHVKSNIVYYRIITCSFAVGLAIGVIGCSGAGGDGELQEYLKGFFTNLSGASLPTFEILKKSVFQNLVLMVLLVLTAISVLGCVAVPVIAGYKGFLVGYSAAVFQAIYGAKFVPFILLGILPSAMLWLPALFLASVSSLKCSAYVLGACRKKSRQKEDFKVFFVRYGMVMFLCLMVLLVSSLIDVYLVPFLLKLVSGLYI